MATWKKVIIVIFGAWLLLYKPFVAFNHPNDPNNALSWAQFGVGLFITIMIAVYFWQNKKTKI